MISKKQKIVEIQRNLKKIVKNEITPGLLKMAEEFVNHDKIPVKWMDVNNQSIKKMVLYYFESIKNHTPYVLEKKKEFDSLIKNIKK